MAEFSGSEARTPRYDNDGNLIPLDKVGQEITVGSYIVYGHALGRCAGLRFGKVLRVKYEKTDDWSQKKTFKIKVWGIDDEWTSYEPVLCSTPGTLNFPDRILVVDSKLVPPDFLALLQNITEESNSKDIKKTIPNWENKKRQK